MSKHYYYLFEKIPVVLLETGSLGFQERIKITLSIVEENTKMSQYSHVDGIYIGNFNFMNDELLSAKEGAIYVNNRLFDESVADKLIKVISEKIHKEVPAGLMEDIIWGKIE